MQGDEMKAVIAAVAAVLQDSIARRDHLTNSISRLRQQLKLAIAEQAERELHYATKTDEQEKLSEELQAGNALKAAEHRAKAHAGRLQAVDKA